MSELLHTAVRAAHEAGSLLLERFRTPARGIASKSSGTDMVSDADRDAESVITSIIRADRPHDALLAEEGGRAGDVNGGITWVIDPLDGTTNFLYGIPQWCVSIACEDAHGGIAGVVFDPVRGETFTAARGEGAFLNGSLVHVSGETDLARSLVITGFAYLEKERAVQGETVARVLPRVRDIRRFGAAALDLAWVACGRVDAYYESAMQPWDLAAGALLVAEAGGIVSRIPAVGPSGDGVVAAGPGLHDALRSLVEG